MSKAKAPAPVLPEGADPRLFLQSVERALRVLAVMGTQPAPTSLSQIADAAGIDRSNAQRICHTLRVLGYLEPAPSGHGLVPGKRVLDRAFECLRANPLVARATPVLVELRKAVQERVDLSLFDGATLIYAARLQAKRETFYATLIGRRLPSFATAGGRAMLATLPEAEAEEILQRSDLRRFTAHTITDLPMLRRKLAEAREAGFALAQQELLVGEVTVGVAIRDGAGRPIGAIHVAGSLSEWEPEAFARRVVPLASEAARALSGQ